jgi:hypothetical protein
VVDVVEVMLEKCKALGPVLYAEHRITWGIHPEKRAAA